MVTHCNRTVAATTGSYVNVSCSVVLVGSMVTHCNRTVAATTGSHVNVSCSVVLVGVNGNSL